MADRQTQRPRGAALTLRVLAAGLALLLPACAASEAPRGAGRVCLSSRHAGTAILCCPDETGRKACFLSRGGFEI